VADDVVWEDLNAFRMSEADAWQLIDAAPGCVVTWVRRDGVALAVWVSHALLDGELWVTTTVDRPKTVAWRRDPRLSACFGVPGMGSVTVVGKVELDDDAALRRRFLEALVVKLGIPEAARGGWLQSMDSDGRLVGRIVPERWITFDERKLWA
jgi:hypothetical protein